MSRKAQIVLGSLFLAIVVGAAAGYAMRGRWWPAVRAQVLTRLGAVDARETASDDEHGHDDHAGHGHAGHDELNSIELSEQARKNIGLKLGTVATETVDLKITIPGMIVERPGRSTVEITAPLTGIVTRIYPIEGETVASAQKLFDMRLTHEELVQAQGNFLQTAKELEVLAAEIERLQKIVADGGIPGRQVLERKYEQQTKNAVLQAQHQALLLHGLSDAQVKHILASRTLLQNVTIVVPDEEGESADQPPRPGSYEIQDLLVERGQSVEAGRTLAVLVDHAELYIEGNGFDKDVAAVTKAVEQNWEVDAVLEADDPQPHVISKLKILYVAGRVDADSRTFHFYIKLPNERLPAVKESDGHRFVAWRYKPGQRVQLTVPVEQWQNRFVLPIEAVAQDGAETYVFVPDGEHFDRRPVHVEYRDRFSAVIADDGSIFPGLQVVLAGAQQMQLALKNKAAGPADPHAGHNH